MPLQDHPEAPTSTPSSSPASQQAPHRADLAQPMGTDRASAATAETLSDMVDKMFSRVDANSDGAISLEEALNAIDLSGAHNNLLTQFQSMAVAIDGNADGSLSKDELSAAILAHQISPEVLLDPGNRSAAANDADYEERAKSDSEDGSNGNITLGLFGSGGSAIDFTGLANLVFTQIDANADNSLDGNEVAAAVALVDTSHIDAGLLGTLDTSAIASLITKAAHPEQPLDHFDQLSVELIGVLAHALNPHLGGG